MTNIKVKETVTIAEINRPKSQCLDTKIAPCHRKLWHKITNENPHLLLLRTEQFSFQLKFHFLDNIAYID